MDSPRNVRLKRKVTSVEPLTPQQQMFRFGLALVALIILFILGVKWFARKPEQNA
jgi:flagellar biogenesis protein FliO